MKKKDKPLRPNPLKATLRGESSTRRVIKVVPKGPLKKPTLKNLTAPKGTGSGAGPGSVKVLKKAESFMKKEKAAGRNPNKSMDKSKSPNKSYKASAGGYNQFVKNTPDRGSVSSYNDLKARDALMRAAAGGKDSKPKGVTPPKKTPPAPKPKGKRRFGRGVGGMGGGGLFGGGLRKSK